MAISKENVDFLFNIMKHYDDEYNPIVDNCFDEVNRALNEICSSFQESISVVPFGCYAIKSNYQAFEPMEFYCVLKADRQVLQKEIAQKQEAKKRKRRTIKSIYNDIISANSKSETSLDYAKQLASKFQQYVGEEDKVLFRNNVVFVKFNPDENTKISIVTYICYDFDGDGIIEFSKLGYKTTQNPTKLMQNIQQKNLRTNGNYLLMCKLIKMLELELILSNRSNVNLSSKTFFVENVLYNVPDKFFDCKEFSEIFLNVVNYLNQVSVDNILIPDDTNTKMFNEHGYYANSNFDSFLRKITFIYKNADQMIYDAINSSNNSSEQTHNTDDTNENLIENDKPVQKINKNHK